MEILENKAGIGKKTIEENKGEIVVYQPDEITRLEVRLKDETVWLNRQQIAQLFGRDVKTIGKHINTRATLPKAMRFRSNFRFPMPIFPHFAAVLISADTSQSRVR